MFGKSLSLEGEQEKLKSAPSAEQKGINKLEHQPLDSTEKGSTRDITKIQEILADGTERYTKFLDIFKNPYLSPYINTAKFYTAYAETLQNDWVGAEQSVTIRKEGEMWSVWCGKDQTTHSTYMDAMLHMAGILDPKIIEDLQRGNKDE